MNSIQRPYLTPLAIGLFVLVCSSTIWASFAWSGKTQPTTFTLKGEVAAVNAADDPPIVMLRVITQKGEEMMVGAIVQDSTAITKKGKKASVEDLAVGEPLILTYRKSEIGALAQSMIVP